MTSLLKSAHCGQRRSEGKQLLETWRSGSRLSLPSPRTPSSSTFLKDGPASCSTCWSSLRTSYITTTGTSLTTTRPARQVHVLPLVGETPEFLRRNPTTRLRRHRRARSARRFAHFRKSQRVETLIKRWQFLHL